MNKRKLSSLPGLKARRNAVTSQMAKLRETKEQVSAELYDRLEIQYREELTKLEPMIFEAQTEGEATLKNLEVRLEALNNRGEQLAAQFRELDIVKQNGAVDDAEYGRQKKRLENEKARNTKDRDKAEKHRDWMTQCTTQETEIEKSLVGKLMGVLPFIGK